MSDRKNESHLSRLNMLYSRLGADPEENISLIVTATREILQGSCALFNRLDDRGQFLCVWASSRLPEDFPEQDTPEGHICYEETIRGKDKPILIPDVLATEYADTDPSIRKYGLRSYLGHPVLLGEQAVGALCIANTEPRNFSRDEVDLISTLAKAVSLEEERKRTREQYEQSQTMVAQMQRLASIGGWELSPDTRSASWTNEMYRIFGLPPGKSAPDLEAFLSLCVSEEDRQKIKAAVKAICTTPSPETVEVLVNTPNGGQKWLRIIGQTQLSNGKLVKIFGSLQDITTHKEIEAQLKKAKEEAENASMAKTEFLANMSHEIRTPLNGVLGMLQLAMRTRLTEEQAEYLDIALHSCRGLLTIINDLLDLSKIEAGKISLAREPLALADTIASVCQGFRHQLLDRGVRLSYSVDSRIPETLVGDGGRLRQILFNLVGNAVKFTPSGAIRLDVSPIARNRKQVRILFSILDTGVGIADQDLDRIFKPFEQINGPYKEKVHGTGLGLGIVRRLVNIMGGTLSLESETGKGTTVYVSIPFDVAGAERENAVQYSGEAFEGLRILMVEDNPANMIAPKLFLEKAGNIVDNASNGREALKAARDNRYDIILMDLEMPEMDGIETTRQLRKATGMATPTDIPIIALTAYAFTADRKRCFDAGMDAFLSKPVDFGELEQTIISIHGSSNK